MTAVYALIYPVFAWLCIRSGFKYFFTAANPGIRYGGFLMESKKEIYDLLPVARYPKTFFFPACTQVADVVNTVRQNRLAYPLIVKPDIGMRGLAAKKIDSEAILAIAVSKYEIDFLIQEFIPFENEIGIFYCRYPGSAKGFITGIVRKEFLAITGDGIKSLLQLIRHDKRFILQLDSLQHEFGAGLERIPAAGEQVILVPYGNHARGSKFLDYSHLIDAPLTDFIDSLCHGVPGFYYGRLDLRYENWQDLLIGKNYSIIELNGAGSEPTHIYDPDHHLFFGWKEIIRHWMILWRISRLNHRLGIPYMTLGKGLDMFKANHTYLKKLKAVHDALLKIDLSPVSLR